MQGRKHNSKLVVFGLSLIVATMLGLIVGSIFLYDLSLLGEIVLYYVIPVIVLVLLGCAVMGVQAVIRNKK